MIPELTAIVVEMTGAEQEALLAVAIAMVASALPL
jgi:hypothetical protein